MTTSEASALQFASRCCKAVTGYDLAAILREYQSNPEAAEALRLLWPALATSDRTRN